MQLPARRPALARTSALGALLLLSLLASLVLLAPRAQAAATPISVGALDWGVKQSFRSYVTGGIAHGSISTAGGASQNPDGTFHFPLSGGSYDDAGGTTVVAFGGSVHFSGHDGQLEMTIADLRVELAPDGARLLADVSSLPFPAGGPAASHPDTELVSLDLTGVDPVIAGGTTSWSAIPATLTAAGAPSFGGFYTAGAAFDALSFSYEGPGGKPIPESWSRPGAAFFAVEAETAADGGFNAVLLDEGRGIVHTVTATGVHAYDSATLASLGSYDTPDLQQFGIAFDPATETIFAREAAGNVQTFTWDAGTRTYARGEVPMTATRTLDYDPATRKLWAIGTFAISGTFRGNPTVSVATRNGSSWDVASYPALDTGGRNVNGVARSTTGVLIAAYGGLLVSGRPVPQATAVLTDTGSSLVATDIPGTVAAAPAAGITTGYANTPAVGPDGRVLLNETAIGAPATRILTLEPSNANPSGYAVAGEPLAAGPGAGTLAVDGQDNSIYTVESGDVVVYRGGGVAGRVAFPGVVRSATGDGVVFAGSNTTGRLARIRQLGTAPAIVQQPLDRVVELDGAAATAAVTFSAAASGDPAPAVRWQQRTPGSGAWADVPGATAATLQVDATAALAGTRYRAVFESSAGVLATQAVTLTVTVVTRPPVIERPPVDRPPVTDERPPARRPVVTPQPPVLDASRRSTSVGRDGTATLAGLRCRVGTATCRVGAPRRVRVKIGRATYWATVLTPATLRAGGRGAVRVRLPRAARRALVGRRATIRFTVAIRSGRQRTEKQLRVTVTRR